MKLISFLWKIIVAIIGFIVAATIFLAALVTVFPSLHEFKTIEIGSYFSVEDKTLVIISRLLLLSVIIFGAYKLYLHLAAKRKKPLVISLPIPKEKVAINHNTEKKLFGAVKSDRLPIFINEPLNDIAAAKAIAQQNNKLVFAVIYDEKHHSKSQLFYSLGCFMEYFTTKKLVEERFVSVLVSSNQPGAAVLVPEDNPLENCLWVVLSNTGEVILREGVYANPDEGLKRVRAVIDKYS